MSWPGYSGDMVVPSSIGGAWSFVVGFPGVLVFSPGLLLGETDAFLVFFRLFSDWSCVFVLLPFLLLSGELFRPGCRPFRLDDGWYVFCIPDEVVFFSGCFFFVPDESCSDTSMPDDLAVVLVTPGLVSMSCVLIVLVDCPGFG